MRSRINAAGSVVVFCTLVDDVFLAAFFTTGVDAVVFVTGEELTFFEVFFEAVFLDADFFEPVEVFFVAVFFFGSAIQKKDIK